MKTILFKGLFFLSITFFIFSCKSSKEKFSGEIKAEEAKLFGDSVSSLNVEEAKKIQQNYLKYVQIYPNDSLAPDFLFKAADLANGLKRHEESLKLFGRIQSEYPDFQKAPSALFMQAFILETEIKDIERAKNKYKEFIQKFPSHSLAPSAQASLDQLNANLSDDELIKLFEKKNQK